MLDDITERLSDAMERSFSQPSTRCWVLAALSKLVAQLGEMPEQVEEVANKFVNSKDVALAQYCVELLAMASDMQVMKAALPVDASCEDLETDEKLGFLDAYVQQALAKGAQPYIPRHQRSARKSSAQLILLRHRRT